MRLHRCHKSSADDHSLVADFAPDLAVVVVAAPAPAAAVFALCIMNDSSAD